MGGKGRKGLDKGRGEWETQTFFVQSMMVGRSKKQMKLNSWEWDHSCNTKNVTAYGKYLEAEDTFNTDGIQGRHIVEYSEQR